MKRIYCIPGGGTTSLIFIQWQKHFGDNIKVEYLDIPGRGYLSSKHEQQSIEEIADVLSEEIICKSKEEEYLIFGYCFGAVVAYEICLALMRKKFHLPETMYICGSYSPNPSVDITEMIGRKNMREEMKKMFYHLFPEYLFKNTVIQKQVCEKYMEILYRKYDKEKRIEPIDISDKEFEELLDADNETVRYVVQLANNYFNQYEKDEKLLIMYCNKQKSKVRLKVPFVLFYGSKDYVIGNEWREWRKFTCYEVKSIGFPCDHFSLTDDMVTVVKIINQDQENRSKYE